MFSLCNICAEKNGHLNWIFKMQWCHRGIASCVCVATFDIDDTENNLKKELAKVSRVGSKVFRLSESRVIFAIAQHIATTPVKD